MIPKIEFRGRQDFIERKIIIYMVDTDHDEILECEEFSMEPALKTGIHEEFRRYKEALFDDLGIGDEW